MAKINLVAVNMGYGHQRTAHPLKELAVGEKVIQANDYPGIPDKDRAIWETARKAYEFISRVKKIPLAGQFAFFIFDRFQKIFSFYPKKDSSKPNFQLRLIFFLIKRGWGRDLIARFLPKSNEKALPLVCTFFIPAFMAEYFHYPGQIFCLICDADISRVWASFNSKASRIKYFVPNERTAERLKLYGVKEGNIFLSGYPLPQEIIGGKEMRILKKDLKYRLFNLDPKKRFFRYYQPLVEKYLGRLPAEPNHPLTLMFAVGGAGAQKEIGIKIARQLALKIKKGEIKIILAAGAKKRVKEYFEKKSQGLDLEIIFGENVQDYFQKFNQVLKKTDILWTKPSELSFYSALGLPIVIAPAIGSQEEFNKRWLLKSGFGLLQEEPSHIEQWLFDWLDRGYLAEAAMQGFIEGEKLGTIKIKEVIEKCPG